MKLNFIKITESGRNVKATVHSSGKLGFSGDAIRYYNINDGMYIAFATSEDENDKNLYAVFYDEYREGALKLKKAGHYYYANTKNMFDELGIDYRNIKIIFDIIDTQTKYDERTVIKLIKRVKKKKTTTE